MLHFARILSNKAPYCVPYRRSRPLRPNTHKRDVCASCKPEKGAESAADTDSGSIVQRAGKIAADLAVNPLTYLVAIVFSVWLVNVLGESDLTIFVLAAFPIVGLTALSKTPVGKQVQKSLEAELPGLEQDAEEMRQAWEGARDRSPYFGAARPQLPPPLRAAHLQGDMPGDYGFDPLGLWAAADPGRRRWYAEAELLHGRWAMLAVVGCLIPEVLDVSGVDVGEPVWWKVGAAKLRDGVSLDYAGIEGFRIAGNQGLGIICACQLVLMGGPEYARFVGIESLQPVGVFLPGTQRYPGGAPFDPAQFSRKPDEFLEQQVKEMKNGRLAMVAMLGFFIQAAVTRQGPVHNLLDAVHAL